MDYSGKATLFVTLAEWEKRRTWRCGAAHV